MSYVEWNGDWSRQQPAGIDEAELYLFPLKPTQPAKLNALCQLLVDGPSGGQIQATPWKPPGGSPFVLLAAARFSGIHSEAATEPLKGHIDELDVGFFVPVTITVNSQPRGIYALNPYLYVDNPAGVIMGREIFGFPKLLAQIGWSPSTLEFDLHSLVFKTNTASTPASQELLLSLKRSSLLSWLAPWFGSVSSSPLNGLALSNPVLTLANAILTSLGAGSTTTSFTSVRLALLKQYRSAATGTGTSSQEATEAAFSIVSISAFSVYPSFLFWASPLTLKLFGYASVDIADTLGLDSDISIKDAFKVVCKLRLEGKLLV